MAVSLKDNTKQFNYNKEFYKQQQEEEARKQKEAMQIKFINSVIAQEGLEPYQTPFKITNDEMLNWTTVLGKEVDWSKTPSKGREDFFYLKNQEDLLPAVRQQFINYKENPKKYNLPDRPTISDAIKIFDQSGAEDKIEFLQQQGIDTEKSLDEVF